jgi:hypothetical protein
VWQCTTVTTCPSDGEGEEEEEETLLQTARGRRGRRDCGESSMWPTPHRVTLPSTFSPSPTNERTDSQHRFSANSTLVRRMSLFSFLLSFFTTDSSARCDRKGFGGEGRREWGGSHLHITWKVLLQWNRPASILPFLSSSSSPPSSLRFWLRTSCLQWMSTLSSEEQQKFIAHLLHLTARLLVPPTQKHLSLNFFWIVSLSIYSYLLLFSLSLFSRTDE